MTRLANEESLSGLTRSLLLGVSLGAITLTQVGCAPEVQDGTAATVAPTVRPGTAPATITVRSVDEQQLCIRVLRTRAVTDINELLTQYPNSRCIAPILVSLPMRVLAGLAPEAVRGMSPEVLASLPPDVRGMLPTVAQPRASIVRTSAEDLRY